MGQVAGDGEVRQYQSVTTDTAPARAPSVAADVTTPLAWATISAAVVTLAYLVAAWQWHWPLNGAAPVGIVTLVVAWFAASSATRATWWTSKTTAPADAPEEGPLSAADRVILLRQRGHGAAMPGATKSDTGISFADFVIGCEERGTTHRAWESMPEPTYRQYKRRLFDGEWAAPNNPHEPRGGWRLKASAEEILDNADGAFEAAVRWMGW